MLSAQVHSRPDSLIETLFTEHRPRAVRYAKWLVGNNSDAEEIVQEAFLRLTRREPSVSEEATEPNQRMTGMLFTTVRNLSIDLLRKKGRRKDVSLASVAEPTANSNTGTANRLEHKINELMGDLPDNWAEALKLKITGDLSYEQIAEVLNCTKAQVRTWIFRARKQLSKELTRLGWLEDKK